MGGTHDGLADALILDVAACVVVTPCDVAHGKGRDAQHLAVTHLVIGSDGVGTDVVEGTGLQVIEAVDAAVVLDIAGGSLVGNGGFGIGSAIAETFFEQVCRTADGASAEDHRSSTGITGVGADRWNVARCRRFRCKDAAFGRQHRCLQGGCCRPDATACAGRSEPLGRRDGRLQVAKHIVTHGL